MTSVIETPPAPETDEGLYRPIEVAALLVGSFKYSRGSTPMQREILKFLNVHYGHKLSPAVIEQARPMARAASLQIYTDRRKHIQIVSRSEENGQPLGPDASAEKMEQDVEQEINRFTNLLIDYEDADPEVEQLVKQAIVADQKWLPAERRKDHKREYPPRPYHSNLVRYGFLKAHPGRPEYRHMFDLITNELLTGYQYRGDVLRAIMVDHIRQQPEDLTPLELALFQDREARRPQ